MPGLDYFGHIAIAISNRATRAGTLGVGKLTTHIVPRRRKLWPYFMSCPPYAHDRPGFGAISILTPPYAHDRPSFGAISNSCFYTPTNVNALARFQALPAIRPGMPSCWAKKACLLRAVPRKRLFWPYSDRHLKSRHAGRYSGRGEVDDSHSATQAETLAIFHVLPAIRPRPPRLWRDFNPHPAIRPRPPQLWRDFKLSPSHAQTTCGVGRKKLVRSAECQSCDYFGNIVIVISNRATQEIPLTENNKKSASEHRPDPAGHQPFHRCR